MAFALAGCLTQVQTVQRHMYLSGPNGSLQMLLLLVYALQPLLCSFLAMVVDGKVSFAEGALGTISSLKGLDLTDAEGMKTAQAAPKLQTHIVTYTCRKHSVQMGLWQQTARFMLGNLRKQIGHSSSCRHTTNLIPYTLC